MYQLIVLENVNKIIEVLEESNFFIEHEIKNINFARNYLFEKFEKKYIENNFTFLNIQISENEFEKYLKEIIIGSVLESLKEKNLINNYENNYFLTNKGKEIINYIK